MSCARISSLKLLNLSLSSLKASHMLLLLVVALPSLSQAAGKTLTRDQVLSTIQAKGCFNKEELKCLGVTKAQCDDYMSAIATSCKDRLPEKLDLDNLEEQERAIENFSSCANQLSQSVLGVSPEKAASCAAK